jgi:hypothetical protein
MRAVNKNRQQQLKDYLDKQVSDVKSKERFEKQKEMNEFNILVSKLDMFDKAQEKKQAKISRKIKDHNFYITQTIKNKFDKVGQDSEAK